MTGRGRAVIIAVVGVSHVAGMLGRSQAARFAEVMVAERNGEIERERSKRKPRTKPQPWPETTPLSSDAISPGPPPRSAMLQ
jgi:hypothetical protein